MSRFVAADAGERPSRFRWAVVALIFVTYTIAAADRANIGIVLPSLISEFGLTKTQAGALASLFFITYAAGQIPAGFLVRRLGVRLIMPTSMLLTSIFAGMHAFAGTLGQLKILRVLLGLAEAPVAAAAITSINNWFPKREKGIAAGIFIASTKAGPALVPFLGGLIIAAFSWHWVFLAFAIPGLLLPFVWLALVPDRPGDSRFVNSAESALISEDSTDDGTGLRPSRPMRDFGLLDRLIRLRNVPRITSPRDAFRSWNIWGVSLGYFLFVGTMNVILAWLPTFLSEERGLPIIQTGLFASMPFIGAVAGNLVGGMISDRLMDGRRKPVMLFSCIANIATMVLLADAPEDAFALGSLLVLAGFLLSLGFSQFSVYSTGITDKATFPVATGLLNTCGQLGGAFLPFATGMILDHTSWSVLFFLLALVSLLALALLLSIVEPRLDRSDS